MFKEWIVRDEAGNEIAGQEGYAIMKAGWAAETDRG